MNQVAGTQLQERSAYFNDRSLFGNRTGVGHYLGLIQAHWPDDAKIKLRGLSQSIKGQNRTAHSSQCAPLAQVVEPIQCKALTQLAPPGGAFENAWSKRVLRRGFAFAQRRLINSAYRKDDFGIFFEPNHLPMGSVRPCVATIHDLSVLELPQYHPAHRVEWWRRSMERAMDSTDRFICVSNATAEAMKRVVGCHEDRLEVIPLGARWTRPADAKPDEMRAQLQLPERYWLHVGTIEPRKNIVRLLDAYASMSSAQRERTKLVLCGRAGWGSPEHWDELINHRVASEVIWTGYAHDDQVAAMMMGSVGVLCPSHYEGFGLPTIEAMALGVPCIISKAPSLVEVTAGHAPAIDAMDTVGWAQAMLELQEPKQGAQILHAQQHAASYSWSRAARAHHDLFELMMD